MRTSPQSKDSNSLGILGLNALTVTESNVKSHDTIKLRELLLPKGLTILLPTPVSLSAPQGHLTKMRKHGGIINLDLWQLNHFVQCNYIIMHIYVLWRNPAFLVTKWHENGSSLGENGGWWRWNRLLFFRTMKMFQRDVADGMMWWFFSRWFWYKSVFLPCIVFFFFKGCSLLYRHDFPVVLKACHKFWN